MKIIGVLVSSVILASVVGVRSAQSPPAFAAGAQAGAKLFDDSVRSILEQHCVDCHGGKSKESGFDMTTRESLLKGGDWGPGIVSGKSAQSQMMVLVRHEEEPFMPEEKPKLPAADIAKLAEWIDAGAPYTRPLQVPARTGK